MNQTIIKIINKLYYIRKECYKLSYILLNNIIYDTNNNFDYLQYGIELKEEEKYLIIMLLYNK